MKKVNFRLLMMLMGVLAISVLTSCNDDDIMKTKLEKNSIETKSSGDGGFDLLGYGYDVRGEFANANSGKARVVDVEKMYFANSDYIEQGIISTQDNQLTSGESFHKYIKETSIKTKATAKFLCFKTSITGSFSEDNEHSSTYSYASYDLNVQRKKLTIYLNSDEIAEKYLTTNFLKDCKRLSARAIVKRYGTHILKDISLGGQLHVLYRSKISSSNKKQVVEAGLNASVLKIFSINANGGYTSSEVSKNKNAEIRFKTKGGDASKSLLGSLSLAGNNSKINIKNWQNSVTLENSQLIGINSDGLIPIYKLIPYAKKQNEVKKYIYEKIYNLKLGKNFALNGNLVSVITLTPYPVPHPYTETYLQTNNGLEYISTFMLGEYDVNKAFPNRVKYFIGEFVAQKDFFNYDFSEYAPSLLGDVNKKPILVKDTEGSYYVQLRDSENILHPVKFDETIQVYGFSKKNAKLIDVRNYSIGYIIF